MNKKNQISMKAQYVTPLCESALLLASRTVLTGSGDSSLYGGSNHAGNDMEDDSNFTYNF